MNLFFLSGKLKITKEKPSEQRCKSLQLQKQRLSTIIKPQTVAIALLDYIVCALCISYYNNSNIDKVSNAIFTESFAEFDR